MLPCSSSPTFTPRRAVKIWVPSVWPFHQVSRRSRKFIGHLRAMLPPYSAGAGEVQRRRGSWPPFGSNAHPTGETRRRGVDVQRPVREIAVVMGPRLPQHASDLGRKRRAHIGHATLHGGEGGGVGKGDRCRAPDAAEAKVTVAPQGGARWPGRSIRAKPHERVLAALAPGMVRIAAAQHLLEGKDA